MSTPLIILISIIAVSVVGLPVFLIYKMWRVKKDSMTHHVGLVWSKTGKTFKLIKMPKDRNVLTDATKTPANPNGDPITYETDEAHTAIGLYPPETNKLMQAPYELSIFVEGHAEARDVMGELREGGIANRVDSSRIVANIRTEKITKSVVEFGDALMALQKELEEARKGNKTLWWQIITSAIILIALIVTFIMLRNGNNAILNQLQILNHGLFGNTTMPMP